MGKAGPWPKMQRNVNQENLRHLRPIVDFWSVSGVDIKIMLSDNPNPRTSSGFLALVARTKSLSHIVAASPAHQLTASRHPSTHRLLWGIHALLRGAKLSKRPPWATQGMRLVFVSQHRWMDWRGDMIDFYCCL
jgi:hypothetical protein